MKKVLSILVVIVMLLSMVPVFSRGSSVVKAQNGGATVEILMPTTGTMYTVGEKFYVNVAISNPTDTAMSGNAVIDPGLTAALVEVNKVGDEEIPITKKPITVPAHGVVDVWWQLECIKGGDSTITVTFNGASDSVLVHQFDPSATKLIVEIIEPTGDASLSISSGLVVKARVTAPLQDVSNVSVTINFDNDLVGLAPGSSQTWHLGYVYAGDSHILVWNLYCKGAGETTVEVSATGDGVLPNEIINDFFRLTQGEIEEEVVPGPFNVNIIAPEKVCTNCGNLNIFSVIANIMNDTGHNVLDTHAVISIVSGSSTVDFIDTDTYPLNQSLGTIIESTVTTEWHALCHAEGNVIFKVVASGYVDMNDNGIKDAGDQYVEDIDTTTVQQRALMTDITEAWVNNDGTGPDPTVSGLRVTVGDDVYVKAIVKNCSCIPYDHPTVSIFANDDVIPNDNDVEFAPTNPSVLVEQFDKDGIFVQSYAIPINSENPNGDVSLTAICDCCEYHITWHLHCKGESTDIIKVATFKQDHTVLDFDSFELKQESLPALTKVIEFFPGWYSNDTLEITPEKGIIPREEYAVSQNWTAVIVVTNIGGRTAEDVSLMLGADGGFNRVIGGTTEHATLVYMDGAVTPPQDLNFVGNNLVTFLLGNIEKGESKKIIIEGHCSSDSNVTFYVPGDTLISGNLNGGENLSSDLLITFYDTNGNGQWDSGEPIVYDRDSSGNVSAGDTTIYGALPPNGTPLSSDSSIKIYDTNGNGQWDSGEPIVYDEDNSTTYNKRGLTGTDSLTGDSILARLTYNVPNSDTIKQIPLEINFKNPIGDFRTNPETGAIQIPMSTKFAVRVEIKNNSHEPGGIEDLSNVVVTLHWGSKLGVDDHKGAELYTDPETGITSENPTIVPLIKEGETGEHLPISWEMYCNTPGNVYFWIELKPGNTDLYIANSANWDDGSIGDNLVVVEQLPETTLEAIISSPLSSQCLTFTDGETFPITVKVKNTGNRDAVNVTVEPYIPDDYKDYFEIIESPVQTIFPVLKKDEETPLLTWTFKVVKADSFTPIPGTPDSKWISIYAGGDNTYPYVQYFDIYIYPSASLKVEIEPLTNNHAVVGSKFDLKVKVTNTGWADAYQVAVTINLPDNVKLQPGSGSTTIPVGILQGHGAFGSQEVTFKLQCEGVGKSTITATATGIDEYGYAYTCRSLSSDFLIRFYDTNGNGQWDFDEPIVYDVNNNGRFDTYDPIIYDPDDGSTLVVHDRLSYDSDLRFYDTNGNGHWDPGERINLYGGYIPVFEVVDHKQITRVESATYTFEQVLPDGPILTITAPEDGFTTNSSNVKVEFSVTGGTPPYVFSEKVDNSIWVDEIPDVGYYIFSNLGEGSHILYIKVTDANKKYYSSFVNVVIDKTPPPAPVASPVGGTYNSAQTVALSCEEAGAKIYYTLDGSNPTISSLLYTEPIVISEGTTTLKAVAVDIAGNVSPLMVETYRIAVSSPCDVNKDGKVDIYDFSILMYYWGSTDPNCPVDFNKDGKVDIYDFSILMYYWTD